MRVERAGQPVGYGLVLKGDGRIVTALSAIGHGNDIRARFSDGATLRAAVVATDRKWDLALLSTGGAHWAPGLRPAAGDVAPGGPPLRRFRWRDGRLQESAVVVEGRRPLIGRDGAVLDDMLVLQGRIEDDGLGSPLIDEAGEVMAIAVQACSAQPAASCQMGAAGASVAVLKSFLKRAPAREPLPAAELGFRGAAAHDGPVAGVRVITVETGSPAAAAGLRAASGGAADGADLIVAVDDVPVTTPDEVSEAINRAALSPRPAPAAAPSNAQAPERQARLLVYGAGKFREVVLPLRPPPRVEMAVPPLPPQKPTAAPKPTPAPTPPQPAPPSAPAAPKAPSTPPANPAPSAPAAP